MLDKEMYLHCRCTPCFWLVLVKWGGKRTSGSLKLGSTPRSNSSLPSRSSVALLQLHKKIYPARTVIPIIFSLIPSPLAPSIQRWWANWSSSSYENVREGSLKMNKSHINEGLKRATTFYNVFVVPLCRPSALLWRIIYILPKLTWFIFT